MDYRDRDESGGRQKKVLDGLRPQKKPIQAAGSFMQTQSDSEKLRRGELPSGWSLDKDGRARPKVQ